MPNNINHIQQKLYDSFEKNQKRIAINQDNINLSYEFINRKTDALANYICKNNINEGTHIGVYVDDKIETILMILGILKARCVFVPLNPTYPFKRLNKMIDAAGITTIFTTEKLDENFKNQINKLKDYDFHVITSDVYERYDYPSDFLEYSEDDDIYIYFTSGTNGDPKAVVGVNKSLVHFLEWEIDEFSLDQNVMVSQLTPFSHDPYLRDIFVPLFLGGTVCIPSSQETILESDKILEWIGKVKISLIHCTPSLFSIINNDVLTEDNLKYLKYVFLAGESIKTNSLIKWYKTFGDSIQLVNLYGPTETTLAKLFYRIQPSDARRINIPIGKPIRGSKVIILDRNMNPCEIGEKGQIFIRTKYRTRGYYNDINMTQKKFIINPFNDKKDDIIYMTGDYGILNGEGNIEFIGRMDDQVKIRGYRIELSEIEYQLLQHSMIKEAVVTARKDHMQEYYICAYMTVYDDVQISEIKKYLFDTLPQYMIPLYYIILDKLPLTVNGKIDKKLLPDPTENQMVSSEYEAPRNKAEEKLVKIWSEILGIDKIGINDNFFNLGGHSLKATSLVSKIHKEFDVQISLEKVFKLPTIKEMAAYIGSVEKNMYVAIDPVEEREYYPVSLAQKRMYFLTEFEGEGINYNMPSMLEITGVIDKCKLENAFKELINRQESFRTYFEVIDGEIVQKIQEDVCFNVEYIENTNASESKIKEKEIVDNFIKPFDLKKAPLFRVTLLKLSSDKHILMYDMHHIVSDGSSRKILINELIKLYDGDELPNIRIQYKDYAVWQNKFLEDNLNKQNEKYLLEEFKGELPVLNLPTDYSRPVMKQYDGDVCNIYLEEELTKKLKNFAIKNNATLFMAILEAVSIVLSKYSGQEDIIIGTVTAGRTHSDIENIIGLFLNNIAFRCKPIKELGVVEYLNILRSKVLKGYECQNYPIDELISKLDVKNDMSRGRLFDVMIILQNFNNDIKNIETSKLNIKPYLSGNKRSEYDMTFYVFEQNDKLNISLEYSTKLFNRETIEAILSHFVNIANDMIDNPTKPLSQLNLLSESDKSKIVEGFNNKIEYPNNKTLHELFEEQVMKTPDSIAIIYENKKLTYKELNEKSNQIARLLRSKGIGKNEIVAILAERSLEMFIGILAILKSGAAYLPIDPIYPNNRINYMIEDSKTKAILINGNLENRIEFDGLIINLDYKNNYTESNLNLDACSTSNDLAYIIYTSGTTGKPKAILTKHSNVISYVFVFNKLFNINYNDVTLQQASFTFDGLVEEVYTVIFEGGKIVVPNRNDIKDAKKLAKIINENKVTILSCSPLILNEFNKLPNMKSVRTFLSSSDILRKEYYSELIKQANVYNMYGPSEATVCTTYYKCGLNDSESVPIGKPLGNNKVYILDTNLDIVPIGVIGEIYIGGAGIANGYLNNNDLTSSKFIPNPLDSNEILYKTGDMAKWLPNGDIEFLGRADFQIKIRGYRIELGEIESHLLKHDNISETTIVVKEDVEKNKYFCVYYVADTKLDSVQLKNYLLKYLPDYMIPSFFIQLDKIPINPNGKVDRSLLPEPTKDILIETEYVQPRNEIERKVVSIWNEILGIDKEKIGINHNFFDLGGNSINILKIANEINKEFNLNISIGEVLLNQTIGDLANSIHKETIFSKLECIVKLNKSRSKKNIFIIHGEDGDVYYYKDLAKLLEAECNVYGIQSRGIKKECDLTVSTKDMIKYYINEIKMIQKEGPYIIAAYCIGCIIAYDLVRMLEDNNDIVEKCIMVDERAFINNKVASIVNIKEQVIKPFNFIKNAIYEKKDIYIENEEDIFYNKKNIDLSESKYYIADMKEIKEKNSKIGRKVCIPKRLIKTPTYVIKAEQTKLRYFTLKDWEKIVKAKVVLTEISGNHETVWKYPHVNELSDAFKEILND